MTVYRVGLTDNDDARHCLIVSQRWQGDIRHLGTQRLWSQIDRLLAGTCFQLELSERLSVAEHFARAGLFGLRCAHDQFTLGEAVQSDSATTLPVRLAVALLKDAKGEIHLDVPVRGDLDDPEFGLGKVILNAFVNLVTRVVTSPFSPVLALCSKVRTRVRTPSGRSARAIDDSGPGLEIALATSFERGAPERW